jgi:hypothetical protein
MSSLLARNPYRRARQKSIFRGFDPILTIAVALLLIIGTLLVYAATRNWYAANGLDPEYYLKRHVINIVIGICLHGERRLLITDYCVPTHQSCGEQVFSAWYLFSFQVLVAKSMVQKHGFHFQVVSKFSQQS